MARSSRTGVLFMQSQSFFGADTFVHSLLMRELDRDRFDVHVACTTAGDGGASSVRNRLRLIPHLTVRPVNFGPTLFGRSRAELPRAATGAASAVLGLSGLAAYLKRNNIQIIHGTEKPRDALYGVALARLTGARSVVHMHVMYHDQLSGKVRWALRNCSAAIGVSEFVSKTLVSRGLPERRVATVVNSIDVGAWDPAADGRPLRRELGIADTDTIVTIAARIFKWKGHAELIRAIAPVMADRADLRLIVVGEDDPRAHPGGGRFSDELVRLSNELGIGSKVSWIGFRENMEEVMAASDVFAMPSFEEPLGLVYLEAMAMARPVIALRSGGVPEVVIDGETGLLSDPGDGAAFEQNIRALVSNPQQRATMGTAGRLRAEALFRPERMARDMERVYEQILTPTNANR